MFHFRIITKKSFWLFLALLLILCSVLYCKADLTRKQETIPLPSFIRQHSWEFQGCITMEDSDLSKEISGLRIEGTLGYSTSEDSYGLNCQMFYRNLALGSVEGYFKGQTVSLKLPTYSDKLYTGDLRSLEAYATYELLTDSEGLLTGLKLHLTPQGTQILGVTELNLSLKGTTAIENEEYTGDLNPITLTAQPEGSTWFTAKGTWTLNEGSDFLKPPTGESRSLTELYEKLCHLVRYTLSYRMFGTGNSCL